MRTQKSMLEQKIQHNTPITSVLSSTTAPSQGSGTLKPSPTIRHHILHLQRRPPSTLHLPLQRRTPLPLPLTKPLIALLIPILKPQISRRSWPAQNNQPVLNNIPLSKRSMPVFLQEFMRVEVFPRRLSSAHEEEVVSHQRCRIRGCESAVDHHGEGNTEVVDC